MKRFSLPFLLLFIALSIVSLGTVSILLVPNTSTLESEVERLNQEIRILKQSIQEFNNQLQRKSTQPPITKPSQNQSANSSENMPQRNNNFKPPSIDVHSMRKQLLPMSFQGSTNQNFFPEMNSFHEMDSYIQQIDEDTWIHLYSEEYRKKMKERKYNIELKD